jgi:hypothetical protein
LARHGGDRAQRHRPDVRDPGYPLWSLTIIATDAVALYGLCAYGSRQNITV